MAHRSGKKPRKPKSEPVDQVDVGKQRPSQKPNKPQPSGKPTQPPMGKKPNVPRTTHK